MDNLGNRQVTKEYGSEVEGPDVRGNEDRLNQFLVETECKNKHSLIKSCAR